MGDDYLDKKVKQLAEDNGAAAGKAFADQLKPENLTSAFTTPMKGFSAAFQKFFNGMWDQGWFGKLMVITLGALIVFCIFQLLHCCIWHRNCVRRCRQKYNVFPPENSMDDLEKAIGNETSWLCCCGKVKTSADSDNEERESGHDIEDPRSSRRHRAVPADSPRPRASRSSRETVLRHHLS